jgi:hypothetical protein
MSAGTAAAFYQSFSENYDVPEDGATICSIKDFNFQNLLY